MYLALFPLAVGEGTITADEPDEDPEEDDEDEDEEADEEEALLTEVFSVAKLDANLQQETSASELSPRFLYCIDISFGCSLIAC